MKVHIEKMRLCLVFPEISFFPLPRSEGGRSEFYSILVLNVLAKEMGFRGNMEKVENGASLIPYLFLGKYSPHRVFFVVRYA